jgi:putative DNA primase/helicase
MANPSTRPAAPEPWPEPVCPVDLIGQLTNLINSYVKLDADAGLGVALWILHAHTHDAANVSPILAISSPEMRCGKSTLVSITQRLTPSPLIASNISPAAVYRAVDQRRPTLLLDEADTYLRYNPELIGILNSGHCRYTATVVRTHGDNFDAKEFSTWSPKVIAMIGQLPPTLQDRAVVIPLRRKLPSERTCSLRMDTAEPFATLLRKCRRFAADFEATLRGADPEVPSSLSDRAADNWRPLLAIADLPGLPDLPDRLSDGRHHVGPISEAARALAIALSATAEPPMSTSTRMLSDIRRLLRTFSDVKVPSANLLQELNAQEDAPWGGMNEGRGIGPHFLSAQLRSFGITPRTIWIGSTEGRTCKGYLKQDFSDAFTRYLPAEAKGPEGPEGDLLAA